MQAKYSLCSVVHCYCPPGMPFYADALRLHVESILHNCPNDFDICIVIYQVFGDAETAAVCKERSYGNVTILVREKPPELFFRRAMGRHEALLGVSAEAFWLADCDFIVRPEFFASVIEATSKYGAVYPKRYNICRTHEEGDRLIDEWCEKGLPRRMPRGVFVPEYPPRAVGGMMFLDAATAKLGYVPPDSRWLRPTDWRCFESFGCDIAHRRHVEACGTPYKPTDDIVGLYRLRHSKAGYKASDRAKLN